MRDAGAHALRIGGRSVAAVPRIAMSLPPRLRRRLALALTVIVVLTGLYLFWFRDSTFVSVDKVEVSGLTTKEAAQVRTALTAAARDMTTLHVREDDLMRSIGNFPAIRALDVEADFPHKLRIRVIEHRATAILASGGERVPVAADGTILSGLSPERKLPVLRVDDEASGRHVNSERTLSFVRLLGAAPVPLLDRIEGVRREKRRGVVVKVRNGPELIFGDPTRLRAKWAAAASVLASPGAHGASYVDVRIPARPAAGGLGAETIEPAPPAGPRPQGGTAAPGADPATPQTAPGAPEAAPAAPEAPQAAPVEPATGAAAPN